MGKLGQPFAAALLTALLLVAPMILPCPATVAVVAEESSPPGDIPDDQVFVPYSSPTGFALKVPEGWARRESGDQVNFTDKYNRIEIAVGRAETAPTVQTVKQTL